jgi:hypothetical protein
MKRLLGILLAIICWTAHAQVIPISGQVVNEQGQPLPYASVRVCSVTSSGVPCTPTASIYLDYGLTIPAANPYSADAYGNYTVYAGQLASPNLYVVQLSPASGVTWSYVEPGPGLYSVGSPALSVQFSNSADAALQGDPTFTFNTTSKIVTATGFDGSLTGNVTGNLTGNVTGNVTGHSSLDCALTGCTMTGAIILPSATPTNADQATTTNYVECAKDQNNGVFNVVCYGADPTGTNDSTTAIQNALNAATPVGGEVYLPSGQYKVGGSGINSACDGILCIPQVGPDYTEQVRIQGNTRIRQDAEQNSGQSTAGSVIFTTLSAGTDVNSAIIAVPENTTVLGNYDNINLYVENLTLQTYPNPQIGCVNAYWASGAAIDQIRCYNGENYPAGNTHTQPTYSRFGVSLPATNNDTLSRLTWSQISGYYIGAIASEHAYFEGTWFAFGIQGVEIWNGYYPISGKFGCEEVGTCIYEIPGVTSAKMDVIVGLEHDTTNYFGCSPWCYSGTDIYDPNNALHGMVRYKITVADVGDTFGLISLNGAAGLQFSDEYQGFYALNLYGTGTTQNQFDTIHWGANQQNLYVDRYMTTQSQNAQVIFGYNTLKAGLQFNPFNFYNNGTDRTLMLTIQSAGTGSGTNATIIADPTYRGCAVTLVNGTNENVAINNCGYLSITGPTAAFSIGGFMNSATAGQRLVIFNNTAEEMTINNADSSSSTANQIYTLSGGNLLIGTTNGAAGTFVYDAAVSKWVLTAHNP